MKKALSSAMLALLFATTAAAETLYVTDILRLGIHRAENTSDRAFDSLVSGTPLEVLERTVNYARVRTTGGQEGWVKSAYLVDEKPAQLRIAEVEAELTALRDRVTTAEAARVSAEQQLARLHQQLVDDKGSSAAMIESLARLERQNEDYEARFERYRLSLPLSWVVAATLLTLVGGFVGGWWWLDALIRRRHGGYRVY